MVEERELEIINRLAQFVINRTTDDIRSELQEYLISIAILESNGSSTLEEICKYLEDNLGAKEFPKIIVSDGLNRLLDKGQINRIAENNGIEKFQLSNSIEKKFTGFNIEYNSTMDRIFDNLYNKVEKKCRQLNEDEKKQIKFFILLSLGYLLETFGAEVASILYKGKLKDIEFTKFRKFEKNLTDRLNKFIGEQSIIICIIEHIRILFKKPTIDFSRFLFAVSQAYYLIQILNLDPKGQRLIKSRLSDKTLYLDTNVLINLIFEGGKNKKQTMNKALDLARYLNYNICVTNRTIDEFLRWIEEKRRLSKLVEKIETSRFEKSKNILEDGALKKYLLKKQKQPSLSWEGFLAKYVKIEDILKENYGISIDNSFNDIIKGEEQNVSQLIPIVQYCYFSNKSDTVAEHDASHIIFIQKVRTETKQDILGPNCWFLTNDSSLQSVEREYHPKVIPSAILSAYWIHMISPFLSPDISNQESSVVFARIFGSSLTTGHIINENIWLKIQGSWLDTEGLSLDMVEDVIGTKYIQGLLKKKVDEVKPEEFDIAIDKALISGFKKQKEQKEVLVKEKNQLFKQHTEEIHELKEQLETQNNEIKKIKVLQKTQRVNTKKEKKIAKLAFLLFIFIFATVDLLIYSISLPIWLLVYQILIPTEIVILMVTFGIYEWLKRQIKTLDEF